MRDDDLPGEPVEPGDLRAGDRVAFTWGGERITCALVSDQGGDALRSDVPDLGGYLPNVVCGREWGWGVSDVRLIERAPREDEEQDEDPNEALAKVIHETERAHMEAEMGAEVESWESASEFTRTVGLIAARAAREYIEAEHKGDLWDVLKAEQMRAEELEAERDEWREVAARYEDGRDKWQAKWRESDEARERAEAERDSLRHVLGEERKISRAVEGARGEWKAWYEALQADDWLDFKEVLARDDERDGGQR